MPANTSPIARLYGIFLVGPSDTTIAATPQVVLIHRSGLTRKTSQIISDVRVRASLTAVDIIRVTLTQYGGLHLWIKFCSADKAERFKIAALGEGVVTFCEHVDQKLYDAALLSLGSVSAAWDDPRGPRRRRYRT